MAAANKLAATTYMWRTNHGYHDTVDFDQQIDWIGPNLQPLRSTQDHLGNIGLPELTAPNVEWFDSNLAPSYPDFGNANVSMGLSAYYDTSFVDSGPIQISYIAPSGRYLAQVEHACKVVLAQRSKSDEEKRKLKRTTLTELLAELRRSLDKALKKSAESNLLVTALASAPPPVAPNVFIYGATAGTWPFHDHTTAACTSNIRQEWAAEWDRLALSSSLHSIVGTLLAERDKRETRQTFAKRNLARRLVHKTERAFCGTNWSRRLWHLLHGSHPPKNEGLTPCQAFGCA